MQKELEFLYNVAKEHKSIHRGCGGEPYKNYLELYNFFLDKKIDSVLEFGTGIGFTAIVMHLASKFSLIDTVENNQEHVDIAKIWVSKYRNINIIKTDVFQILPFFADNSYECIFFDVYGPKEIFLKDFERILKRGGYLISANTHLKSAEQDYFLGLDNKNVWHKIAEFGDTKIFLKI